MVDAADSTRFSAESPGRFTLEHQIHRVELSFGSRPPLSVNNEVLAEISHLCRKAGGRMPATAMWPVVAVGRLQLGTPADAIYTELAERAAWAAMKVVAPRLGIGVDAPLVEAKAGAKELGQILGALQSTWRVLPGRAPSSCADVPQRIRVAKAALSRPERLFSAGKALHEACSRDEPPGLPWFALLGDVQDAA